MDQVCVLPQTLTKVCCPRFTANHHLQVVNHNYLSNGVYVMIKKSKSMLWAAAILGVLTVGGAVYAKTCVPIYIDVCCASGPGGDECYEVCRYTYPFCMNDFPS